MTIGKKMICCSEKSGEDKLLSGSLGPCPCLFCIVILTSLCHQQGETGQTITIKYNKCHQMSSSASAHQSWVTTHWPIWSLSYRHRIKIFVTKLLKFYFLAARNLVCFSHSTGDQTKDCDQTRGFKTCFTRYNSGICIRIMNDEVDSWLTL